VKKILLAVLLLLVAAPLNAYMSNKSEPMGNMSSMLKKQAIDGKRKGTVLAAFSVESYTYTYVDDGIAKVWVASPAIPASVGDKVETDEGNKMENFNSKSLGLTFEKIFFVSAAKITSKSVPPAAKQTDGDPAKKGHSGVVKETFSVEAYTYILIDEAGKSVWLASEKIDVKAGDRITAPPGQAMYNFRSKTLNRTFEEIYFVNKVKVVKPKKDVKKQAEKKSKDKGVQKEKK
jgi:hypothetical protein